MGKRSTSTFERRALDNYATPFAAVPPLIPHLAGVGRYIEPCCGDGDLIGHLSGLKPDLVCTSSTDIRFGVDALELRAADIERCKADAIITNPPWERATLHALISHLPRLAPCWLLFDADWAHTKQAALLLPMCSHIVSAGRLRWIRDSPYTGKDNAAWYRFDARNSGGTKFIGRGP